ncbi:MAG TPA: glycerol-3-phosphate 1-O-acyltransferase PlsY [Tepidisphaeraceae bacterium]|nr:glycerol-3-phosphate 1-O-acyltransferase PlsY [Tepidisphaeraceae bacterium]
MTPTQFLLLLIPIAYVVGAIPFGLLIGLSRGVDVRSAGSGNIGATNVGRLLGKQFFFLVFFLDLLKSLVPMAIASWFVSRIPEAQRPWPLYLMWLLVGFAAVIGHMFSVFLRFKGGKGVATSAGVVLGLYPYFTLAGLVVIGVFIIVFVATRYISLGSIVAACAFPLAYFAIGMARRWPVTGDQLPLLIFAIVMGGLIVWKHRANIARLRAGTESPMTR